MKKLYSNATVYFNENEIIERESLIHNCFQIIKDTWRSMNRNIQFFRVETPILTPNKYLQGHIDTGFPLLKANEFCLRPEIAGGCFEAFFDMYPQELQRKKVLPVCVWQAGKSFREEKNSSTMRASRLRLKEFWQLEFELICDPTTKSLYISDAIDALIHRFGGIKVVADELPHYSEMTLDWEIDGIEIAGCSIRKDLTGFMVHEVSIGLDRLLNKILYG